MAPNGQSLEQIETKRALVYISEELEGPLRDFSPRLLAESFVIQGQPFARLVGDVLVQFPAANEGVVAGRLSGIISDEVGELYDSDETERAISDNYSSFAEIAKKSVFASDFESYQRVFSPYDVAERLERVGVNFKLSREVDYSANVLNQVVFAVEGLAKRGYDLCRGIRLTSEREMLEASGGERCISSYTKSGFIVLCPEFLTSSVISSSSDRDDVVFGENGANDSSLINDPLFAIVGENGRHVPWAEARNSYGYSDEGFQQYHDDADGYLSRVVRNIAGTGEISERGLASTANFLAEVYYEKVAGRSYSSPVIDAYLELGGKWYDIWNDSTSFSDECRVSRFSSKKRKYVPYHGRRGGIGCRDLVTKEVLYDKEKCKELMQSHAGPSIQDKNRMVLERMKAQKEKANTAGKTNDDIAEYEDTKKASLHIQTKIKAEISKSTPEEIARKFIGDHNAFTKLVNEVLDIFPAADDDIVAEQIGGIIVGRIGSIISPEKAAWYIRQSHMTFLEMAESSAFSDDLDGYVRVRSPEEAARRLKAVGVNLHIISGVRYDSRLFNLLVFAIEGMAKRGYRVCPNLMIARSEDIKKIAGKDIIGSHNRSKDIVVICSDNFNLHLSKSLLIMHERPEEYKKELVIDSDPIQVFAHENGHSEYWFLQKDGYEDSVEGYNKQRSDLEKIFRSEIDAIRATGEMSEYGLSKATEFIAEFYAGKVIGKRFSKLLNDMYRKLGGKWYDHWEE